MKYLFCFIILLKVTLLSGQSTHLPGYYNVDFKIKGPRMNYDSRYNVEIIQDGITVDEFHTDTTVVSIQLLADKPYLVLINHVDAIAEEIYFPAQLYYPGDTVSREIEVSNIICAHETTEDWFPDFYFKLNDTSLESDQLDRLQHVDSTMTWQRSIIIQLQASKNEYEDDSIRVARKRELKNELVAMGIPEARIRISEKDMANRKGEEDGLSIPGPDYSLDRRVVVYIYSFNYIK